MGDVKLDIDAAIESLRHAVRQIVSHEGAGLQLIDYPRKTPGSRLAADARRKANGLSLKGPNT